jgi:hypothetical protein
VTVRFTPEARLAVREKRAWWEQHREKAPRLFVEELAAVVAKLREAPTRNVNSTPREADASSGAS